MTDVQAAHQRQQTLACPDLHARFGKALHALPYSFRILLENAQRAGREADVAAILAWLEQGPGRAEVAFTPRRLLMHDTTAVPALVDLAMMRQELARRGGTRSWWIRSALSRSPLITRLA